MEMIKSRIGRTTTLLFFLGLNLLFSGCGDAAAPVDQEVGSENSPTAASGPDMAAEQLALPELAPVALNGQPLKVVATTSIIGDVVAQVGGEHIALATLMGPGQDPHGYQPAARDLTAAAEAQVLFINGWDLEEGLVDDLANIGGGLVVPVSAGITPLPFGDEEHEGEAGHHDVDPHVWLDIANVIQWVENVQGVLSTLDPANAAAYEANAAAYQAELEALAVESEAQLADIPAERRFLVTNHDALSYFATAFDFTVLGTVIPGISTLAEPSASDLAQLIAIMEAHGSCTIFAETAFSDDLAHTVAGELDGCARVQVLPLYTGALGPPGSGADSYLGMFGANVAAIREGLGR